MVSKPDKKFSQVRVFSLLSSTVIFSRHFLLYLDIGPKFLQPDKSISKEIMPDYLHLTPRGYQIWAEALEPTVAKFMGEKK